MPKNNACSTLIRQLEFALSGDAVSCTICGFYAKSLHTHIRDYHCIDKSQYIGEIISDSTRKKLSAKIAGEKNPWFDHKGKHSPWSKNNPKFDSDLVEELKAKVKETKLKNCSDATRLDYYTSRGLSEHDAKAALSKRQNTFSLEKCIKKYGQSEGLEIFNQRQVKWLASFNNKSEEELADIIRRRTKLSGTSKLEKFVVDELSKHFELETQFYLKSESKRFFYDIKIGNVLVEVNGDYWHANPRTYAPDALMRYKDKECYASDIWKLDKEKTDHAKQCGFDIVHIWEMDLQNNKDSIANLIEEIKCSISRSL